MSINVRSGLLLILLIGSFCLIAYMVEMNQLDRFDHHIIAFVQGLETNSLTTFMKILSFIGSTRTVVVISLLSLFFLYKVLNHRKELTLLVITMVGSALLNVMLKSLFQRPRPEINQIIPEEGFSFPSGHSMAAFSLYGILTFLLWRHISTRAGRSILLIVNSLMILLIGISRVYLGSHYPSDVVGAYTVSGAWLFSVVWCFQWLQDRKHYRMETT